MLIAAPRLIAGSALTRNYFRLQRGVLLSSSPIVCASRWSSGVAGGDEKKTSQSSPILTAAEFSSIAPMVLLRQALKHHTMMNDAPNVTVTDDVKSSRDVISRAVFDYYCSESHVSNSSEALRLLEEAGVIVSISDGKAIHLRPAQLLEMQESLTEKGGISNVSLDFFLEEANTRLLAAEAEKAKMEVELEPALKRAVHWRRLVWGGALCFAGMQLAIISRLTYFDLDWDIMEPISYFIGTATTIVFFLYFIRHGHSLTCSDYDRTMLPAKVKKYVSKDFDWKKYEVVCRKVEAERQMVNSIRNWVREH
ncbi:putative calcium uniporter protein, mitochondrial [Trypanosoma theileri]|uniref:Putative calcium uniporter protein, mitochondrial n=1 Tax=Trypanosoma theileri TaxID=67003 RepID=A0A1X0P3Z9_9TRYP|nr:putative calcium uniporter protein, mitochondrial [Trypanosoma theileri]ORC91664.1 putative calcium uniporter protein, mitochondrial [Trypanosoma theileri]